MFEPQCVHHSGVQYGHQQHRDYVSNKEPGETVRLWEPFTGPVLSAEISFFVKVHSQEEGNVKDQSADPRNRDKNLKIQVRAELYLW